MKHFTIEEEIRNRTHGENEMNKVLNRVVAKHLDFFKNYVGLKIVKQTEHSFLSKIKTDLDKLNIEENINPLIVGDYSSVRFWVGYDNYSLYLDIKISFSGGSYENGKNDAYTIYNEKRFYLGNMKAQSLEDIKTFEEYKFIDYKEELKTYEKAKKQQEDFEKTLTEFKLYRNRQLIK